MMDRGESMTLAWLQVSPRIFFSVFQYLSATVEHLDDGPRKNTGLAAGQSTDTTRPVFQYLATIIED